jgi:hypothetical protein
MMDKLWSSILEPIGKEASEIFKSIVDPFKTNPNLGASMMSYGMVFGAVLFGGIAYYIATKDNKALSSSTYAYILLSIPVIAIGIYMLNMLKNNTDQRYKTLMLGLFIMFTVIIFYGFASLNSTSLSIITYVTNLLFVILVLGALAIFFYAFSNYLKSQSGWTGFFIYVVFYIPCLILDFMAYIKREFELTPNIIYLLFVAEILGLLTYLYLPKFIVNVANQGSIVLLPNSKFLDTQQVISDSSQFELPSMDTLGITSGKRTYRENYAISMWIYMNNEAANQLPYSKETTIFSYGGGKPMINYRNNVDSGDEANTYVIYFTNNNKGLLPYSVSLPSQKWNNFVFNYSSTSAELFVNGTLETSFAFQGNLPIYSGADQVIIGSDNGLNGAICNVRYFPQPLKQSQIANNYTVLASQSPPTLDTSA